MKKYFGLVSLIMMLISAWSCKTAEPAVATVDEQAVDPLRAQLSDAFADLINEEHQRYPILSELMFTTLYSHVSDQYKRVDDPISSSPLVIIADDKSSHAWQLPDGRSYITTGMLKAIETDDQLTAVFSLMEQGSELDYHWDKLLERYERSALERCCKSDPEESRAILEHYIWDAHAKSGDELLDLTTRSLCDKVDMGQWQALFELESFKSSQFYASWFGTEDMRPEIPSTDCPSRRSNDRLKYAKALLRPSTYQIDNGPNGRKRDPNRLENTENKKLMRGGRR